MKKTFFAGNLKTSNGCTDNNYDSDNNYGRNYGRSYGNRSFLRNSDSESLMSIPRKQPSSFQGSSNSNLTKSLDSQTNNDYNFYQSQLNQYVIDYKINQEYQKIHLGYMADILSKLNIFDEDDNKKSLHLVQMCNLIWSKDTQKACITCMNNGSWIINLHLMEQEINSKTINGYQLAYLTFIIKFAGQFTTDILLYNACLLIATKLENNRNIIHMISFNKTFRPKHTLFPEKNPTLNRIACFNPSIYTASNIDKISFYKQRILYSYKLISENNYCNNALLKARQIYLLNSLIEYNKLITNSSKESDKINLNDLFNSLKNICRETNIFDLTICEKNCKSMTNIIKSIHSSTNSYSKTTSNVSELDIIQINEIDSDITMIELLDMDTLNGDNNTEINHIILETSMNIADQIYNSYINKIKLSKYLISEYNKELITTFIFIVENKMMTKNNYAYLNMLAKINQNNWILDNYSNKLI